MKFMKFTTAAGLAVSTLLVPACADAETQAAAPAAPKPFASDRITVKVEGSGPDVILIPGLTASRDVWRGTVDALPGYRYHLVQVNGFAGTKAAGNASGEVVRPVAREIARYIAEQRLQKPALIGHSMGGTLAMIIATEHPAQVGKLMVVDMLPQPAGLFGGNATSMRPLADGLRDLLTSSPGGRRLLGDFLTNYAGGSAKDSDPDVVARAAHELALTDMTPELSRIRAPFAIVYATPAAAEAARISANYRAAYSPAKGADLIAIANSGHMIMADQPARFRAALKAFLTQ